MNASPDDRFRIGLVLQVLAGSLMFGIGIGGMPLWFDELAGVSVAQRGVGEIFEVLGNTDANMGFYYLILHFWLMAGDSEVWLRVLSLLAAVATIPVTSILARRLFGDGVGLATGFVLAGSMFMVAHAQNARAYSLALLMVTLATLFFVDAMRRPRPVTFFAYGATSTLALYLSPLSGLVLVAHFLSLALLPQARERFRPLAITWVGVLLAVSPLAVLMATAGAAQVDYFERPGLERAFDVAGEMLGMWNGPLVFVWAVLIVAGVLALWGVGSGKAGPTGQEASRDDWRWGRALVVAWAGLPPLLLFAYSQFDPLFAGRYLLASTPALAMIVAVALVSISRRSKPLAAAVVVVMVGVTLLTRIGLETYGEAYRQGWAEGDLKAARLIAGRSLPGDGIVFHPPGQRLTIDMHFEREVPSGADLPDDLAVVADAEELGDLYATQLPRQQLIEQLRRHPRVWLLSWDSPEGEVTTGAGRGVLKSEYRRLLVRDYGQVRVGLYQRQSSPPAGGAASRSGPVEPLR